MTSNYDAFLAVGAVLMTLGAIGFLTRRNLILMMLSAELMLHGVSLTLLAFGQIHGRMDGQAFTVFVLTIAACEAGLALAIVLSLYQRKKSLDVDLWTALREPDLPAPRHLETETPTFESKPMTFPGLTPAGALPGIDADAPLEPQLRPHNGRFAGSAFEYGDPDKSNTETSIRG